MENYNNKNAGCGGPSSTTRNDPCKKLNEIPDVMASLGETISRMEKQIAELIEKLAPVLGPENHGPMPDGCANTPESIIAPLANDLKNLNGSLRTFNMRLSNTIDRIQL